ncbi:hypothetical protein, partial [Actinoallomurus acaciae]
MGEAAGRPFMASSPVAAVRRAREVAGRWVMVFPLAAMGHRTGETGRRTGEMAGRSLMASVLVAVGGRAREVAG